MRIVIVQRAISEGITFIDISSSVNSNPVGGANESTVPTNRTKSTEIAIGDFIMTSSSFNQRPCPITFIINYYYLIYLPDFLRKAPIQTAIAHTVHFSGGNEQSQDPSLSILSDGNIELLPLMTTGAQK